MDCAKCTSDTIQYLLNTIRIGGIRLIIVMINGKEELGFIDLTVKYIVKVSLYEFVPMWLKKDLKLIHKHFTFEIYR